mmetsp:Transcript_10582/g.9520  ORF Transcript_10582/g.9520 Transcript_10582/m.9520 type:complete len:125 (+) Transcript_10582:72-446(+)
MDSNNIPSVEQIQLQQQQAAEAEERRNLILDQILEPQAKDRLNRLSLVRKDKARAVGDSIISAATNGRLKGKVTEEQLIAMLEQLSLTKDSDTTISGKSKGITIQRRKYGFDDDDDEDDDSDLL